MQRRTSPIPFRPAIASAIALLLPLLAACGPAETGSGDGAGSRFGDPYEIVLGETPAGPDSPPHLAGDTLKALVAYPGGCEDHAFALVHATADDTTRLWVTHDANGEDCEAYIRDELALPVPPEALRAGTVLLLNPNDSVPFVVPAAR